MNLDFIVFPAPNSNNSNNPSILKEMIWVPRKKAFSGENSAQKRTSSVQTPIESISKTPQASLSKRFQFSEQIQEKNSKISSTTSVRPKMGEMQHSKDDMIHENSFDFNGHGKMPENIPLFKTDSARNTSTIYQKSFSRNNSFREHNIREGHHRIPSVTNSNYNLNQQNDCSAILEETPNTGLEINCADKKLMSKYGKDVDGYDSDELVINKEDEESSNIINKMGKYQTKNFIDSNVFTYTNKGMRSKFRTSSSAEGNFDDALMSNRDKFRPQVTGFIPCLLLEPSLDLISSQYIILYFHGNGEDITLAHELLDFVRDYINIRIIAMEYPGYGLYRGHSPSAERIFEDAEIVYDFLVNEVGYPEKNIIIFGRSIGSGPATHVAARRNPGALILMSAFTSLRAVVRDLVGPVLQYLIKDRFNNLENIKKVSAPTFLIHGIRDRLIPFAHSQELHSNCKGASSLLLPKEMDHIEFDFESDLSLPLYKFLVSCDFRFEGRCQAYYAFPKEVYIPQAL